MEAVQITSAILHLLEFATKLVHGTRDVYRSSSGQKAEDATVELIADEMKKLALDVQASQATPNRSGGQERSLRRLTTECGLISDQIMELLQEIKPKAPTKRHAFQSALKSQFYKAERAELESRLEHCRSQLGLSLASMARQVQINPILAFFATNAIT